MYVIICRRSTRAAVVDPEGRKANWSRISKSTSGSTRAGYMKRSTTIRSKARDWTGTTEIGQKSPGPFAGLVFATGRIRATRHCSGIVDEFKDKLNNRATHFAQTGANRRRNHAGTLSRPSAVGLSRSRMKKVLASLKNSEFGDAVDFRIGCWYVLSVDAAAKKSFSSSTVAGKSASAELRLPVSLFTALQSCLLPAALFMWPSSLVFCFAIRLPILEVKAAATSLRF